MNILCPNHESRNILDENDDSGESLEYFLKMKDTY